MASTAGACRTRRTAALLTAVAVALMMIGFGATDADAASDYLGSGTFVACGLYVSIGEPTACPTIDDALAAAKEFGARTGSPVVIELLPGSYCPFDISDLASYRDLTIVGVGLAGILPPAGTPLELIGPEAGLTRIVDDPLYCGSWPQDVHLDGFGTFQTVTLRNLVLDGSQGASRIGIRANVVPTDAHLFVRDVETTGFSQVGLDFTGNNLYVDNSAFVHGGTGISALGATLRVASSTLADNDHGLSVATVRAGLVNDTIVHNGVEGVNIGNFGNTVTATNNVIAYNGEPSTLDDGSVRYGLDCTGTVAGDFETSGGGHNLLGESCRPSSAAGDVLATADPGRLVSGGAPTDYVPVPPEARGIGNAAQCPATDQREGLRDTSELVCDAGSVQTGSVITPRLDASPSLLDLGTAPAGQTVSGSFLLSQAGGDELGVNSVVGGAGVAVPTDGDLCTHALMVPSPSASSCAFAVSMTAPAAGTTVGGIVTVTYNTGATLVLHVQIAGAGATVPPAAPTAVTVTGGNAAATVRWSQPAGTAAASWEVQRSSDGGAHWAAAGTSTAASLKVTGLTNGVAYVFRVRARDAAGDAGAWSATSARVTPVADASALTAPASATVAYGHAATLRGTLTDTTTHAALAGATVQLLSRAGTSGSWHVAASARTGSSGVVTFSQKPSRLTQYELRYVATTTHRGATSARATVHVHAVVHAAASPKTVHHKHALRVYGTLSPAGSGTKVKLQRSVHGTWKTVATAKVKRQHLPDGRTTTGYVLTYKPSAAGKLSLRVVQPATKSLSSATSSTLRVKVV